ncbi:MAG: aminopeptidase [Phycisphaerae bacterium]|nr:MAG: aminopeptidase [Phycisphaerae bacterium]
MRTLKLGQMGAWSVVVLAGSLLAQAQTSSWVAVIDGVETPCPEIEMGDPAVVRAILDEGKNRNQVMSHLRHLTKEIGARLTGSSALENANNWTKDQFASWGLSNAHLDKWGEIPVRFDRGPSYGKVVLKRTPRGGGESQYEPIRDMQLTWQAWAVGTEGPVRGPVVKEPQNAEEFLAVQPKLYGSWVLIKAPPAVGQRGIRDRVGTRYQVARDARRKVAEGTSPENLSIAERLSLEPIAGYITTSSDERVWTGGAPGWRNLDADAIPPGPQVVIRRSDYDFINSRVADGEPVEAEFDLNCTFTKGPIPVYNTIAEIPGTEKPDEVVIISAHLDSWNGPGSEGCTDNGTGSSVTLEAARILMAVGAKPKRTIRFILWTGEEQGLLGSRAYVEANREKLEKISAVFVDDGGTNYEGGIPAATSQVDYLAAATAPTNNQFYSEVDKKYLNVNIRKQGEMRTGGGGSDHQSFIQAGVPGFFWDEVGRADYGYGWHTQNDTYDLAIAEYLVQSSTNAAIVAYRLACAPELLSRPPAAARPARPPQGRGPGAGERPAGGAN